MAQQGPREALWCDPWSRVRTPTVAKEFQIVLRGVVEADLELCGIFGRTAVQFNFNTDRTTENEPHWSAIKMLTMPRTPWC